MQDHDPLTALLNRLQDGDLTAIGELATVYRPEVKEAIRYILTQGNRLRREMNSSDVLHSLVCQFLARDEDGRLRIGEGKRIADGRRYLGEAIRNRVASVGRKASTQKRTHKRAEGELDAADGVVDSGPAPDEALMCEEQVETLLRLLSQGDRNLVMERMAGKTSSEIAAETGQKEATVAKRFQRALCLLTKQLGGVGDRGHT